MAEKVSRQRSDTIGLSRDMGPLSGFLFLVFLCDMSQLELLDRCLQLHEISVFPRELSGISVRSLAHATFSAAAFLMKEEGRGTNRNEHEASKGSTGISGL